MKRIILTFTFALSVLSLFSQVKVSILGDSYSTYAGWIPEGHDCWYGPEMRNDVKDVSETWWYELIEDNGLSLEKNNSWSGATICNTGYNGKDFSDRSFLNRADDLGEHPDIIYVFGGTNDAWAGSPLGEWGSKNMYTVRPATQAMFKKLKENYPEALIVAIVNTELSKDVEDIIVQACETEAIPYVKLESIDKQSGHPSINGMRQISKQVWKTTAPLLYQHLRSQGPQASK